MPLVFSESEQSELNPLDLVEKIAVSQDWPYFRQSEDELAAELNGQWCNYKLWFSWHPELGVMHLSCALDIKVPSQRQAPIYHLLALANEKLWLGHFEIWSEENLPVFRHSCLFRENSLPSLELVEDLVDIAVNECERFYPAFQYMLWAGRTAEEAILSALLETEGEA